VFVASVVLIVAVGFAAARHGEGRSEPTNLSRRYTTGQVVRAFAAAGISLQRQEIPHSPFERAGLIQLSSADEVGVLVDTGSGKGNFQIIIEQGDRFIACSNLTIVYPQRQRDPQIKRALDALDGGAGSLAGCRPRTLSRR
jgi:hypothetical protein